MENAVIRETLIHNPKITEELGACLYGKIKEVVTPKGNEVFNQITEQDCIDYIIQLAGDKTVKGHAVAIQPIYWQLQNILGVPIQPAPDEWDRLFNVDFFIKTGEKYIGLQIKPVNSGIQLPEIFKEYNLQAETHKKFTEQFGGKVFYLFSAKVGEKKEIQNKEVIHEILQEIKRLTI